MAHATAGDSFAYWQARLAQFAAARDWDQFHTPKDLAEAVCIEAAELLEHFRFRPADLPLDTVTRAAIGSEVADVLAFALLVCNRLRLDPAKLLSTKMRLNEKRYPVSRCRGRADKYTAYTTV